MSIYDIFGHINPSVSIPNADINKMVDSMIHYIHLYMYSNIHTIVHDKYTITLKSEVCSLFKPELESFLCELDIVYSADIHINKPINDIFDHSIVLYYKNIMPKRSFETTFIRSPSDVKNIQLKINAILNKPQPVQRTTEWYLFRHNLITASSAWKCMGTFKARNQIIYEKCIPLDIERTSSNGMASSLQWGVKYEPLSTILYERKYNTKIVETGCIQHNKYKFLGASPDGINVCTESPLCGRMLEIKNVVSRNINGVPKKEYWTQMQVQMEVCDLDECDFLETKFTELDSEEDFISDGGYTQSNDNIDDAMGIIHQYEVDGIYKYEYAPMFCTHDEYSKWSQDMSQKHNDECTFLLRVIYWKLIRFSCVLVLRNTEWFSVAIKDISDTWDIILDERESGYEHRAPTKRVPKPSIMDNNECLIAWSGLTG